VLGVMCIFYFSGGGFSNGFALYSLFYSTVFMFICFLLLLFVVYVCNGFSRKLIPDNLCSYEWQELVGIIISVCMGFLYIEKFIFCQCDVL
jgi:hypothetical protein